MLREVTIWAWSSGVLAMGMGSETKELRKMLMGVRTVEETDIVASSSSITQGYARLTDVGLELQLQDIF